MQNPTPDILKQILSQDFNYNDVSSYLVLLIQGQGIEVYDEQLRDLVALSPDQGWKLVEEWAIEHNFSISHRGSRRAKIEALLSDIRNREKLRDEAASALNSMKEKARYEPPRSSSELSDSYLKANKVWKSQLKSLEDRLFDPLYQAYMRSPLLAHIQDPGLKHRAAMALAGSPELAASFSNIPNRAGGIASTHQIMRAHHLLRQAVPELEPLLQEIYSDRLEQDAVRSFSMARDELVAHYPGSAGGVLNTKELNADLDKFGKLKQSAVTLTSLEDNLIYSPAISPTDRDKVIKDIRKIIIAAGGGPQLSGQTIINQLVKNGSLKQEAANALVQIYPSIIQDIEILEIKARTEIIGASVTDRKKNRELFTQGLAESLGLNASTFWLSEKELNSVAKHFLDENGIQIDGSKKGIALIDEQLSGLKRAIAQIGDTPNLEKFLELQDATDKLSQYKRYYQENSSNAVFFAQDLLSKLNYNFRIIREPYDIASRRIWSAIDQVDEVIQYPVHKVADWWDKIVDGEIKIFGRDLTGYSFTTKSGHKLRVPFFDLPGFAVGNLLLLQKNVAVKTFTWSYGLAKKGGLYTAIFKPISNYSFLFVQVDGFHEANFAYGHKLVGNFLNWGADKLWHTSWTQALTSGKATVWGFAKKIGDKVTSGTFSKVLTKIGTYVASLGVDLGTGGLGLIIAAITIGLGFIKKTLNGIKDFFTNYKGFRDKVLNVLPIIAGFVTVTLPAFLLAIPGALSSAFVGLLGLLGGALTSLGLLFAQAFLWAGVVVVSFVLIFNIFKITTKIDPGLGIFSAIACDLAGGLEGGETAKSASPTANTAICIAKVLNECQLNPLFGSSLKTSKWQCVVTALLIPGAIDQLEASAGHVGDGWTSDPHLQCVGLAAASAGAGFPQQNANLYATNIPSGWRAGSCQPGSLFVDSRSSPGHIGVVIDCDGGANIVCVDANYVGAGVVRDPTTCRYPKSFISTYLNRG